MAAFQLHLGLLLHLMYHPYLPAEGVVHEEEVAQDILHEAAEVVLHET